MINPHDPSPQPDSIAELKRRLHETAEALARREGQLQFISDSFSCGMIYQLTALPDGSRQFTYVSKSVEALHGVTVAEAMADALSIYGQVHEEDIAAVWAAEYEALRTMTMFKAEMRIRMPDGRIRWSSFVSVPKLQPDGLVFWDGIEFDVTELKNSELAVRQSEQKYRDLFSGSRDGIVVVDPHGRFVDANAAYCDMVGYSLAELKTLANFSAITPEKWRQWELDDIWNRRLLGQGYTGVYEKEYIRKDGVVFPVELQSFTVFDACGNPKYLWGIARDITRRKRAEAELQAFYATLEHRITERTAELEAANRELESFSYSVSHDLRAPLRAIDSYLYDIAEDYLDCIPEQGRELFGKLRAEVKRMGQLVNDLLAFSTSVRQPLQRECVDTVELVRGVIESLTSGTKLQSVEFVLGELPACHADASLLTQVWQNLLSNAVKFSRRHAAARVEVGSLRSERGETVYFVRDNGVGFDMRYASKLFGVFQRLHLQQEFEGTGVGLALAHKIINRHQGRIWAEAEEGKGAVFYFTIGDECR